MTLDTSSASHTSKPKRVDGVTWILIGLVLLPLLVEAIRVLVEFRGYHATTDNALNEMIVRDLGRHVALVGPYARSDWLHPGPLFFYLMLVPYHLFGANSAAMLVGALLINACALVVLIAIGRRWGGYELAVPLALACALIVVRLPHGYLADPWNPSITVLPFGAFLALCWAAACDDRWAFPAAVFAGTFCVQTHIGYLSLVLPVLAWCAWRVWRNRRATERRPHGSTELVWGLLVFAMVWALPVFQQVARSPGNISQVVHYFRTSTEPTHTLLDAWRIIAAQFGATADWIVGFRLPTNGAIEPSALRSNPIPVLLLLFAAAVWTAWRARGSLRDLATVLVIALLGGAIGLSRTLGPMYDYRLRWIWVLAGMSVAFTVAVAYHAIRAHWSRGAVATIAVAATLAMIALSGVGVANALASEPPDPALATRTTALSRQLIRHLPRRAGVVVTRSTSFGSYIAIPGLMLRLTEAGIPVKLERKSLQTELTFGSHRIYTGEPVRAVLMLASGDEIAKVRELPDATEVAFVSGSAGTYGARGRGDSAHADDLAAFTIPVRTAHLEHR